MQIGIAVHSEELNNSLKDKIRSFIKKLSLCIEKPILVLGGYWGGMKFIIDEALSSGINSIIVILPIERENVELPNGIIKVKSGCDFRCRSVILVRSSDILVALGGGVGTIIEILIAYAMGKPIYILTDTRLDTDKLESSFGEYIDERKLTEIKYLRDPEKLADMICREKGKKEVLTVG
jgi:uncharacterized protein (TIGR00725 family)